jgi:RsiW-degrading membrane proteinase PrsW (M82 family)
VAILIAYPSYSFQEARLFFRSRHLKLVLARCIDARLRATLSFIKNATWTYWNHNTRINIFWFSGQLSGDTNILKSKFLILLFFLLFNSVQFFDADPNHWELSSDFAYFVIFLILVLITLWFFTYNYNFYVKQVLLFKIKSFFDLLFTFLFICIISFYFIRCSALNMSSFRNFTLSKY